MSHSSFIYWNLLPNEIKVMITKRLEKEDRLNLRACSKNDKELVDSVKMREIYKIQLSCHFSSEFVIALRRTKYSQKIGLEYDSFDDFQQNVIDLIKEYDFIEMLEIDLDQYDSLETLNLSSTHGQLVKVRKLYISGLTIVESCLEQVDPFNLKYLKLDDLDDSWEIYDIPMVINVNELHVYNSYIYDDQLLKLENQTLTLRRCKNLTLEGINKYIQKCVLNLDNKQVDFKFGLVDLNPEYENLFEGLDEYIHLWCGDPHTDEALLNSKSKNFRLNVYYTEGVIEGRTSIPHHLLREKRLVITKKFIIVERMVLYSLFGKHTLSILKTNNYSSFDSYSFEKLQKKLIEEIEGIDYIRSLHMKFEKNQDKYSNLIFCPKNRKIAVGELRVDNARYIFNFLKQIESTHLEEIKICGKTKCRGIYNLQQIHEATKLKIEDCRINDAQLLQLNAVFLNLAANKHRNTTNSGINAFLKKCIHNLNKNDYNITFTNFIKAKNTEEIFEGLERFNPERQVINECVQKLLSVREYMDHGEVLFTSPFSEYLLGVIIWPNNHMEVRRIEKKFIEKMWIPSLHFFGFLVLF